MVGCAEKGDFRSPRPEADYGRFTVQTSDAPLSYLRRKNRNYTTACQKKKVRLTPINESDEINRENSFNSFSSLRCDQPMTPISMDTNTSSSIYLDNIDFCSRESSFDRSDTPLTKKKSTRASWFDNLDALNEELENVPKETARKVTDPELRLILSELPPRPKCSRKVLPPCITNTNTNADKPKKRKLLKLRRKNDNTVDNFRYSPETDMHAKSDRSETIIKRLTELDTGRPKSAESAVKVISLAELSAINSTSVPDLPSIFSKLSPTLDLENDRQSASFDDSGALSTPRKAPEMPLGTVQWDKACLKGSDMSSFYNMWERDQKKRPFDKKSGKSKELKLNRSCMCSLKNKNCQKNCFGQKSKVLPPIK